MDIPVVLELPVVLVKKPSQLVCRSKSDVPLHVPSINKCTRPFPQIILIQVTTAFFQSVDYPRYLYSKINIASIVMKLIP